MPRSRRSGRLLAAVTISLGTVLLLGSQAGIALGADEDTVAKGKAPKVVSKLDWTWHGDAVESKQPGSMVPKHGDIVAVGIANESGNGKVREQLVAQYGKKDTIIGADPSASGSDNIVHVVVNLAGAVPNKLRSDVVVVVTTDGAQPVPYSTTAPNSYTQGASFAHVIGRYGTQQGRPLLSGDDSTAGDAPLTAIDFELPGSGAGGYDKKTKSFYTSFKLPDGAQNIQVYVFNTENGEQQVDALPGPIDTNRIAIDPGAAAADCAKIELFARFGDDGQASGIFDVRGVLAQPAGSDEPGMADVLSFAPRNGTADAVPTELLPETLPGSGLTVWAGSIDTGSASGAILDLGIAGPSSVVQDAFGNVAVHAGPDELGTIFGSSGCGSILQYSGCTYGGGVGFFSGLLEATGQPVPDGIIEVPFLTPTSTEYCVVADEAGGQSFMAFGIEPTPFSLDRHQRDMEANMCPQTAIDIGIGGVKAECPGGPITLRWLETGIDDVPAVPGWGFRPDLTILPDGAAALGLDGSPGEIVELVPYSVEAARDLLREAGWIPDDDGYIFTGE